MRFVSGGDASLLLGGASTSAPSASSSAPGLRLPALFASLGLAASNKAPQPVTDPRSKVGRIFLPSTNTGSP